MVKVTLADGMVIEGTVEEIRSLTSMNITEEPTFEEEAVARAVAEEPEEEPLKVGDYVVALPKADLEYGITDTDMKLGKIVGEPSFSGLGHDLLIEIISHTVEDEVGSEYPVKSRFFRKATEEEVKAAIKPAEEPLKVGDYVVITGKSEFVSKFSHNEIGDLGVIVDEGDRGSSFKVKVPGRPNYSNYISKKEVRRATDAEVEAASAPTPVEVDPEMEAPEGYVKVDRKGRAGDFVKFTDTDDGYIKIGKYYEVFGVDCDGDLKIVDDSGNDSFAVYKEEEFEVYGKEEETEPSRKPGEFRVGDVIRALNTTSTGLKEGHLAIVESVDSDGDVIVDVNNKFGNRAFYSRGRVELVAPVEARVDR